MTSSNSPHQDPRDQPNKKPKEKAQSKQVSFPQKLMEILSSQNVSHIITWLPEGRSFVLLDEEKFADEVLPNYFNECKYTSFVRKLYRWGFRKLKKGPDCGSYFHPLFQRDRESLVSFISCNKDDPSYQLAVSTSKNESKSNADNEE